MLDWNTIEMAREHCDDLLRVAEQERLARQARAGHLRPHHSVTCRLLRWLGRELVAWGLRLQERQGTAVVPAFRPVGSAR